MVPDGLVSVLSETADPLGSSQTGFTENGLKEKTKYPVSNRSVGENAMWMLEIRGG